MATSSPSCVPVEILGGRFLVWQRAHAAWLRAAPRRLLGDDVSRHAAGDSEMAHDGFVVLGTPHHP